MSDISEPARQAAGLRELIAVRAYELWENEGQPHGHDLINWHQAEQDIMSCVLGAQSSAIIGTSDRFAPARN